MQLKAIRNRSQKFKFFIYKAVKWVEVSGETVLLIELTARSRSRPICSGCGHWRPWYDTMESRQFEFVPLWGIPVFFVYAMHRVECCRCGIKAERVPWVEGKHLLTTIYMQFLARWAKQLSWQDVARIFKTSREKVFFRSVEWSVQWGLTHRNMSNIHSIGGVSVLCIPGSSR
jgi:transposase